MNLVKEIEERKLELILLANKKKSLTDPEVYQKSCAVDELVIKFMKSKK